MSTVLCLLDQFGQSVGDRILVISEGVNSRKALISPSVSDSEGTGNRQQHKINTEAIGRQSLT